MNASSGTGRLLAGVLAGAAVLAAGCSTSNASAGLATTTPKTAPASPSAHATTSPSATPSTSAGLASCKAGVLSVLLGQARAAHRTVYYPVEFKNISATPCTLYGFPGVSFFGKNYSVVGSAATTNHRSPAHLVGLSPEGTAIAQLSVVNAKRYPSRCRQTKVSGLLVQPPGLTNSVRLPLSGLTCGNAKYHVLAVDAVVEGPPPPQGD